MAQRPKGYGLTAEVKGKIDSKYNKDEALQARDWIISIIGEDVFSEHVSDSSDPVSQTVMQNSLKNGVALCKLINALSPGSVKKVNESKMAFKMMENIGLFLAACENYGMRKADLFQTVDLYEGQNMAQVIVTLHALGSQAQTRGFKGPTIGTKYSEANKRTFTEEQLRAGEGVIGLQAGSNKGATQAGMNIGNTRHILD